MARYITTSDFAIRYAKVFSDIGSSSLIEHMNYAEAAIEGALSSKFSTPFSSNNVTVKDLSIDAAYARSIKFKDTEKAKLIQDSIEEKVKALLEGTMEMSTTSGTAISADINNNWSETQDYTPVFGKGDITDFKIDSSQLYDEELARD